MDRERILTKLDELQSYLEELKQVGPASFEEYQTVEKKRACERLLQIAIEAVLDVCHLFVRGLRLGLPAEEDDIFDKLVRRGILSSETGAMLRKMKGLRNILVHEYGRVDDRLVYAMAAAGVQDFVRFQEEILSALRKLEEEKWGECSR